MWPRTMSDEEDNEYVALGSYDALAAYLYKQGGADSVLAYFRHIGGFASEDFEEAIAALEHRGLDEVAKVMQTCRRIPERPHLQSLPSERQE